MTKITRMFEEPIVIMVAWAIFIVGILGATKLIGAKLPTEGIGSGVGDLLRNA